ncbi:phosphoribosylglycinamide formyltransferase [Candidatus Woesearchaeota archaeon]|nr:phosphoribosylglycinamide formyltransferase [Candidatus Woesearchaeota archaeon]
MLRLGVLASTKGTDMQAIIDAIGSKNLDSVISVVLSDKEDAYALERAKKYSIKAVFLNPKDFYAEDKEKSRERFDKEVSKILDENKVDLILLIGYMRFLSPWFVAKYKNKIMNIHPSLLPKYAGGMDRNIHSEVLKNKEKVTGATLHFVDEGADTGPIILQKEVKISKDETVDSLKEKVQRAEQEIILKAIDLYGKGKVKVVKNKVVIK